MRKAKVKVITYVGVGFLLLIALPLVLMYVAATMVPGDYRPIRERISPDDRREVAKVFVASFARDFWNKSEDVAPFEWTLTEDDLNQWVSCIDEIAFETNRRAMGTIPSQMEGLGLSGWCISLTEDGIKVMVRSTQLDKVVSATLTFQQASGNRMLVGIGQVRIGKLMVPRTAIMGTLRKLRERMGKGEQAEGGRRKRSMDKAMGNMAPLLQTLLDMAIDNKPQEVILEKDCKPTRIEKVEIRGDNVTFHFQPVRRTAPEAGNP